MRVRCPHCRNAIDVDEEPNFAEIACPGCGSSFSLSGDITVTYQQEATPRKVGHFLLMDKLGTGANGTVWKARDTELDRIVALKILRKDNLTAAEAEFFLREARSAAQLNHSNIVSVHEFGRDGDTLFIVSDYISGYTLSDWMTKGRAPIRECVELVIQIANGLQAAHERGVIHRDLKPSNIMLAMSHKPLIMDFGLAKRESGEVTMTMDGAVLGTPAYMSPEQAKGDGHQCDNRSDIYSLGVMLYELITGERPFRGNTRILLTQVINDTPAVPSKYNPSIHRDLETVCMKCLEKEAAARYQLVAELRDDLQNYLDGHAVNAKRPSLIGNAIRWYFRKSDAMAITAGVYSMYMGTVFTLFGIVGAIVILTQLFTVEKAANGLVEIASAIFFGHLPLLIFGYLVVTGRRWPLLLLALITLGFTALTVLMSVKVINLDSLSPDRTVALGDPLPVLMAIISGTGSILVFAALVSWWRRPSIY